MSGLPDTDDCQSWYSKHVTCDEADALERENPNLKALREMLLRAEFHGMQLGRCEMRDALCHRIDAANRGTRHFVDGYRAGMESAADGLAQFFAGLEFEAVQTKVVKHCKVLEAIALVRKWSQEK